MTLGLVLAAALLAAAQDPNPAIAHVAPASPAPAVGEAAPDFAYETLDGYWRNLHDILVAGDVLLVFGASDEQLRSLQRDREQLLAHGVVPIGVLAQRDDAVWKIVRRDGVEFSVLSDPRGTIAGQYGNATAPGAHWFVIDQRGRVRASGEGASAMRDWSAFAVSALGREPVRTARTR